MRPTKLPVITESPEVRMLIDRALKEDIGAGDVTTRSLVAGSTKARAVMLSRDDHLISGTTVAAAVFQKVDPKLKIRILVRDGGRVKRGGVIMTVSGRAGSILTAERTALNFVQRMTGIATLTGQFVAKVKRYGVTILDTRKTTPGLRALEKYAVLCGGGKNHRMGLHDMALVKDNHRSLWAGSEAGDLGKAVAAIRKKYRGLPVEVEVENTTQLLSALRGLPEWILLDNMKPGLMRMCVKLCAGRSLLEASGGITLANAESVASTGVDAISLGCLTHSAPAADLSLEIEG